jgi:hypothetical protein
VPVRATSWTDEHDQAADWPTLYSQYLLRVANQSAEMGALYNQVMDRVARNELPPTVLEDRQTAFAQTHGAVYSNQFAEITMQFFTGMLQTGTAYTDELAHLVMPEDIGEPLPPPLNIADPIRWYQQLSDYATELNAQMVRTYQLLLERVADGQISRDELEDVSNHYAEQHFPAYMQRMSALFFDLLNGLNDLYAGYQEEFLRSVLASADMADPEGTFALNLTAPLGKMASASMLLANTTDAPTTVRCSVSDVRRADGVGPAFVPDLKITPDNLSLEPGDEVRLTVALTLAADDFDPGALYIGELYIKEHGEPRMEVPLRIKAARRDQKA